MSKHRYDAGDVVVLKSGAFRFGETNGSCRIVAVLPDAYGLTQYRVQFDGENCERRITHGDISHEGSVDLSKTSTATPLPSGSSWINVNTIKIKK
ncbi:cold-shock protein [Neorhizobium sp. LMR1-1-1.1]